MTTDLIPSGAAPSAPFDYTALDAETRITVQQLTREIRERMERGGAGRDFEEFEAANPDLTTWKPSILASYYREETLRSDLARRVFVLPDRSGP